MKLLRFAGTFSVVSRRRCHNIIKSKYKPVEIPDKSVTEFVFTNYKKWPNKPMITCSDTGLSYTYKEVRSKADSASKLLREDLGLAQNDVVGLVIPNCPDFPVAVHGILQAALRLTFINPIFTEDEILKQFVNAEVKCLIGLEENKGLIERVAKKLDGCKGLVLLDGGRWKWKGKDCLKDVEGCRWSAELDLSIPAILPYSSGTTGVPKGVLLTHRNCIANMIQLHDITLHIPTSDTFQDRVYNAIPFFHIYGFNGIMNFAAFRGGHIISMPKFMPESYVAGLKKYKPTQIYAVPSLMLFIASHPLVKAEYLNDLVQITTGAAPARKSLIEKCVNKIGRPIKISQGYGLTETSPAVLITPKDMDETKIGSTGCLPPLTEAKVISETGEALPHDQPGELCVRGPQVMQGYLKNDKATRETLDSEGWLHTGDIVYYDKDEMFYIIDRSKELIKVKGNQVSPTELEGLIMELDEVADVAVVGIEDEIGGENPRAFVVLKQGCSLKEDDIHQFINPRIVSYKRLSAGIRFIDMIPRNHNGKIMRKELKSMK